MESPTCRKTAIIHQTREMLTSKPTFTQGVSEKLLKNGEHKLPPEHTFIRRLAQFELEIKNVVFPIFSNFFGTPCIITNKANTRIKRFTFICHKILVLVEFSTPGQLSKVKSRRRRQFFELIPGGCPGGCTQL